MFLKQQRGLVIDEVFKLDWSPTSARVQPRTMDCLSYRCKGDGIMTDGDKNYNLSTGDIIFLPKQKAYRLNTGYESITAVHFDLQGEPLPEIELFSPENREEMALLFEEMYLVWNAKEAGYYHKTLSLFYTILARLEQDCAGEEKREIYDKLKPAMGYLQNNLTNRDLSVKKLQEECHFSETYFRTLFFEYYGMKPKEYILQKRIGLACEYLKTGHLSIESVAERCGFGDSKHFAVLFKKQMGISPLEYKKSR